MERYVHHLTQPLRSPPSVVREVEQARDIKGGKVPAYTAPPVAPPSDGPPMVTVYHFCSWEGSDTHGHEGVYPWRCERCGQLVADLLTTLRVGCHDHAPHGQGGLTLNDVFVLGLMNCDTTDDDSPAPFIRGLESRGVPTRKVARNDTAAVRQLAEMTSAPTGEERAAGRGGDEAVTVAHENTVWGLERHVVVYLERGSGTGYNADRTGRLRSMSRSTAQVIWVKDVMT
ncbi:uncharacterized protein [Littorina saxatilis]|uniref:uncharacterized protein isoform X2 n=1 Tax=Littorina saxatilis TaxID=31220 RepID=UPI0038B67D3C